MTAFLKKHLIEHNLNQQLPSAYFKCDFHVNRVAGGESNIGVNAIKITAAGKKLLNRNIVP